MLLLRREHEAIVNHQLCITNTFEQVFKEKMLKLYKKVRYLCNTHGYPFTKNIYYTSYKKKHPRNYPQIPS